MTLTVERAKRLVHTIVDRRIEDHVPRGVTEPIRGVVTEVFPASRRALVLLRGSSTAVPVTGYPALPVTLTVGDEVVLERGRDGWLFITHVLGRDGADIGLPEIVVRASGGDDAPAIRAAVDRALPGTTIVLPDELYLLKSMGAGNVCVDIAGKYNLRFVGRGADKINNGAPDVGPSTVIKASTGTTGCTMFRWRPLVADATDDASETFGGGMQGISLAGNGVAAVCIELQGGVNRLVFRNMWVGHATTNALLTGQGNTSATVSGWHSTYQIRFEDVSFRQYTGAGTSMIVLDGNANATGGEHSYHFRFDDCVLIYSTGSTAVLAKATDDIFFFGCGWATSAPNDATTYAIRFDGSTNAQYSDSVVMLGCYGANLPHMRAEGVGLNRPGRGHFVMPMVMTDSSARPEWEEGGQIWYADTLGRHNLRRDGRTSSDLVDDFMGGQAVAAGGTGGTNVGDMNWTAVLGSAGSVTNLTGPLNHPGVKRLANGAGATAALLTLRNDNTNRLLTLFGQTFFYYAVFRLTVNNANTICRVGLSGTPTTHPPAAGIYIEKLAGESSWFAVTRSASVETRTSLGAVSAGTGAGDWVTLEIHRRYEGAIGFSLTDQSNHSSAVTHTTNETTGPVTPIFMVVNSGAVDSPVDIDFFQLTLHGLVR